MSLILSPRSGMLFSFQSNRNFSLWAYSVGHKQLVLRSTKHDADGKYNPDNSQIDILFKGVMRLDVDTGLASLAISEVFNEKLCKTLSKKYAYDGVRIFSIESIHCKGRIVCLNIDVHESLNDYYAPDKWGVMDTVHGAQR